MLGFCGATPLVIACGHGHFGLISFRFVAGMSLNLTSRGRRNEVGQKRIRENEPSLICLQRLCGVGKMSRHFHSEVDDLKVVYSLFVEAALISTSF